MKRLAAAWLVAAWWATPLAAQTPAPARQPAPLIVISLDAFRADYLDRGLTPALSALAREGVRATAMHPSFPSQTFPNHYTLVTGLRPDHHGLIGNAMRDRRVSPDRFTKSASTMADPRWWNGATPLWVSAARAGKRTAAFGWPGTDIAIQGRKATYADPWRTDQDAREAAAMALNWLDLPVALRPALQFLYIDTVDEAGHTYGPASAAVNSALRAVDAAIAALVAGLKRRGLYERTNLVVLSDHGLAAIPKGQIMMLDDLVDPAQIDLVFNGPVAALDPVPGFETAVEKALAGRHAHATCWRKHEIPPRFHYGSNPRVPAIVCAADDGWRIATRAIVTGWSRENPGDHGYDPANPHMNALFLARGPAFRKGARLPPFDNVDVYALLAKLSGVTPEKNDGNPATFKSVLK